MRRFRYTLIAVCLVLLFLGVSDLTLWFNNQAPQPVSIETLEQIGAPAEWLEAKAGYQDLDRAISTSGSLEMEALLVPLVAHPDQEQIHIMVETRDPHQLKLFQDYHFFTDTLPEKKEFLCVLYLNYMVSVGTIESSLNNESDFDESCDFKDFNDFRPRFENSLNSAHFPDSRDFPLAVLRLASPNLKKN